MSRNVNVQKGKQGFQPASGAGSVFDTRGATHIPSAAPSTPSARTPVTAVDGPAVVDQAYDAYLAKTRTNTTGTIDTRRFGTYEPADGPIDQWQVSEGFTVVWERNPLVPGRDVARVELDIPELSGRHNDIRELLRENQPADALRALAARLHTIAEDMETTSDTLPRD